MLALSEAKYFEMSTDDVSEETDGAAAYCVSFAVELLANPTEPATQSVE